MGGWGSEFFQLAKLIPLASIFFQAVLLQAARRVIAAFGGMHAEGMGQSLPDVGFPLLKVVVTKCAFERLERLATSVACFFCHSQCACAHRVAIAETSRESRALRAQNAKKTSQKRRLGPVGLECQKSAEKVEKVTEKCQRETF